MDFLTGVLIGLFSIAVLYGVVGVGIWAMRRHLDGVQERAKQETLASWRPINDSRSIGE